MLCLNEEALAKASALVRLNPEYADYYKFRAEIFDGCDEKERAKHDIEKAISLNPEGTAYWNRLESLDWELKNIAAERKCSSKILQLAPKTGVPFMKQGLICEDKGMFEEAISSFTEAISLTGDDPDAYYFRARVYYKMDKLDEAEKDVCAALKTARNDSTCFYLRGRIYEDKKELGKALYDYSRAIALNPSYAPAYRHRGGIYFDMGEKGKAHADSQKAREFETLGRKDRP